MASTAEPELIPVAEAAAEVRKHPRTVRRWIDAGKLTGYRLAGYSVLVDRNDVQALITKIPTTKSA